MQCSEVIAIDNNNVHAGEKGRGSNVMITELKINFAPTWIFPERNSSWNPHIATK